MALALYRKYRPRTFAEVIGQEHVTEPLSQALRSGRLHHAYLFSGPRGCGKTSSARILARSLNCEQGPTPEPCGVCASCRSLANDGAGSIDVIEIDAASHGGVDDARDLREKAFFAPAGSRYKIYVIDEAHMVSSAGFNALLKLVEEPPEYVKFIFATTEPEKVLGTIRSRTHHYPFRLIPPAVLRPYLQQLTEAEGVHVDPAVLPLVVRAGGGSARDTLSVLDQLISGSGSEGVSYPRAVALLGVTDVALIDEMCDALAAGDGAAAYQTIDRVAEAGHDPRRFAADLLERFRDLIVLQQVPDAVGKGLIDGPADQLEQMGAQATRLGPATLSRCADIVHNGLVEMRGTTAPRLLLELITARMLLPGADDANNALLQRLERVERRLTLTTDEVRPQPGAAATAAPGAGGISAARAAVAAAGRRAPGAGAAQGGHASAGAVVASAAGGGSGPGDSAAGLPGPGAPGSAADGTATPVSAMPGSASPVSVVPAVASSGSGASDSGPPWDTSPGSPVGPDGPGAGFGVAGSPGSAGSDVGSAAWGPAAPVGDSASALGAPDNASTPALVAPGGAFAPSSVVPDSGGNPALSPAVPVSAAPTPGGFVAPGSGGAAGSVSAAPVSGGIVSPASGGPGALVSGGPDSAAAPASGGAAGRWSEPAGVLPDAPEEPGFAEVPGQLSAASIREVWPEIMTAVSRKSKKIAALAQGATVRDLEGQTVVLTFRFPAHAKMVAAEPTLISDALYEALGGRWQIRCDVAGESGPSPGSGGSAPRSPRGGPAGPAQRSPQSQEGPPRQETGRTTQGDVSVPTRQREAAPGASMAVENDEWPEPARPGGLATAVPTQVALAEDDEEWPEPARPGGAAAGSRSPEAAGNAAGQGFADPSIGQTHPVDTEGPGAPGGGRGFSGPGDGQSAGTSGGGQVASGPGAGTSGGGQGLGGSGGGQSSSRSGGGEGFSGPGGIHNGSAPGTGLPVSGADSGYGQGLSAGQGSGAGQTLSDGQGFGNGRGPGGGQGLGEPGGSDGQPDGSGWATNPSGSLGDGSPGTIGASAGDSAVDPTDAAARATSAISAGGPVGLAGGPSSSQAGGPGAGPSASFGRSTAVAAPNPPQTIPGDPPHPGPAGPTSTSGRATDRTSARNSAPAAAAPPTGNRRPPSSGLAAARAAAAGAGRGTSAAQTAKTGAWSDGSLTEEAPYDPEFDGPPAKGGGPAFEGFDPGDEPLDDVIDEKTARQSSEQQAVQLLRDALGAEKISES